MKTKSTYFIRAFHALIFCCCLLLTPQSWSQVNVTTYHNDNSRTGMNVQETILTPAVVNGNQFGRLFQITPPTINGYIFAQPLYVSNLNIPESGTFNVVIVATEADMVYAFNADSNQIPANGLIWSANLLDAAHGATPNEVPLNTSVDIPDTLVDPRGTFTFRQCVSDVMGAQVGLTSTPVIDLVHNKIYVEAKSKTANNTFVHRLHVLDTRTGLEVPSSPITISGQVTGTNGQPLVFDALHEFNRTGILLSNGVVYVGFGSHCDWTPFEGWLFAYDATTLSQRAVFSTSASGSEAAIWMSGAGPAADANGNIFLATGNGLFNPPSDFGNSILKLSLSGSGLAVADYFTPFDQASLNTDDDDLGAGGVLLLPDQTGTANSHLLVMSGKFGSIYLVDRGDDPPYRMGELCGGCTTKNTNIVQEITGAFTGNATNFNSNFYGMPVYWNGNVYFWAINDVLKKFSLSNGILSTAPVAATDTYGSFVDPTGANLSVSANGNQNGIVWSLSSEQPATLSGSEILKAHDANSLALLYSSTDPRDDAGKPVKFAVPTVANGKVYVGSGLGLSVYGLVSTLTVNVVDQGSASGSVTSNPPGISCSTNCSARFASGSPVTLTAAPSQGASVSWSVAGCSGTSCTVTFSANSSITVTFAPVTDAAQFLSQSVPTTMISGLYYHATLNFKNTGTSTWDTTHYWLESQNPANNTTWGPNQVALSTAMYPGYFPLFRFVVRAPQVASSFQWRMVKDGNGFGDTSPNVSVNFVPAPPYYQGCWVDDSFRALPNLLSSGSETVESCRLKAANAGLLYGGLQAGGQCFGGNNLGRSPAAEDECNMACTANPNETCGGTYRNSIWSTVQIDVSWVKPSGVSYGPANTLTVQGDALRGTGTVQMLWQDVTVNGPWNTVAAQSTPANNIWANTIPSSSYCHTFNVEAVYSNVTSGIFTYNGLTAGYCNEKGYVAWIQPQSSAGFGPPGSLAVAGNATGGPAGSTISLWWSDLTAGGGWNHVSNAATPDVNGTWFGSIPNVNYSHQYNVYAIYDAFSTQATQGTCTYQGNGSMMYCPH